MDDWSGSANPNNSVNNPSKLLPVNINLYNCKPFTLVVNLYILQYCKPLQNYSM